ncbi:MAG: peptidoglycan-associated lipoprotein Pal [Desulfobulbaceae bacterium]|nr:peptidoglycan-associated lipoprotein Pal [Desulfobulbaceae bacterium]
MKYSEMFRVGAVAIVVVSLSLFAGGCAKKTVRSDEGAAGAAGAAGKRGEGMGAEESLSASASSRLQEAYSEGRTSLELRPIYFDFDKSNIRPDQQDRIDGNATYLKNNPAATIRIEGNCDERGTNEYNMALGERRALAAKKYLLNVGISEDRLQTVSYGEEKPLQEGHDEAAWEQNRRDDFAIIR